LPQRHLQLGQFIAKYCIDCNHDDKKIIKELIPKLKKIQVTT